MSNGIPEALAGYDAVKVISAMEKVAGTSWEKYAGGDLLFGLWMKLVDKHVSRKIGLGVLDLADTTFRDFYDDGIRPAEAAELALANDDTFGMVN